MSKVIGFTGTIELSNGSVIRRFFADRDRAKAMVERVEQIILDKGNAKVKNETVNGDGWFARIDEIIGAHVEQVYEDPYGKIAQQQADDIEEGDRWKHQ